MQMKKRYPSVLIASVLVLTVWLDGCGCLIMGRTHVIEEPFAESQVRAIHHGETTKKDILEWFGPPLAIARRGKDMKMPLPEEAGAGSEDVNADSFNKIFPLSSARVREPQLYYYNDSEYHWTEFYLVELFHGGQIPIPPVPDKTLTVKRLWILIDGQSGNVVDHLMEVSKTGISHKKS